MPSFSWRRFGRQSFTKLLSVLLSRAASCLVGVGVVLADEVSFGIGPLTNPLHANAKVAFSCFECRIEAGLIGQVAKNQNVFAGETASHEVHYFISVRFVVRRVNGNVSLQIPKMFNLDVIFIFDYSIGC